MKEINKVKFAKLSEMPKDCYDKLTDEQKKEVQDFVRNALKEALKDDDRFWDCIKSQMTVEEDTDFGFTPDGAFDWVHKYGCYLWVDNPDPYVKVEIKEQGN